MPLDDALLTRLSTLLERVRLGLERDGDSFVVRYEKERHPIAGLPLDALDPTAEQAELIAVAAGLEAAVKYPGELAPGEVLRDGAATLLPKIERRRFVRAYDAVLDGRGAADAERLYWRDLGDDLVTCYVLDGGWRFSWVVRGRVAGWDASPDTVHSVARSNLYARHEVDYRAVAVAVGDGYDAARAVLIDDVFYDRIGADGVSIAIPSRDRLLVGPELDPALVAAAYSEAAYPLCPHILQFHHGGVERSIQAQ